MDWNGTGKDKSHFRFVGCLEVRSSLVASTYFLTLYLKARMWGGYVVALPQNIVLTFKTL
jgi:hypothetical protein